MANNKDNSGAIFGAGIRNTSGKDLGVLAEKAITDEIFRDDGTGKRRCKSSKVNKRSLRRNSQFSSAMIMIPDWTSLDQFSPFYNPKDDKYHITIPTPYETLGKQKEKIFGEAQQAAALALIEVYNKFSDQKTIQQIVSVSKAEDYFIPLRPNPKCGPNGETIPLFGVKVLVTVPAVTLDSIPLVPEQISSGPIPIATKEINLVTSEVRKKIKDTSNTLRGYQEEAENSGNTIRGMALDQEADRLEAFMFVLENLLSANGILLRDDRDDLIIIGTDDDYKILYVLFDDGDRFLRLEAGYKAFINSKPASHDRTVKLLADMGKIAGVGHPKFPVTDFVRNLQTKGGTVGVSFDKDVFDFGVNRAKEGKPLFSKDAAKDLESFIKVSNSKPAKTESEKQQEDVYLSSGNLLDHHASSNSSFSSVKVDFVADATLSAKSIRNIKDKLKTIDTLYDDFFHRVNICRILQIALDCLKVADRACRIGKAALLSATCEDFLNFFSGSLVMRIMNISELEKVVRGRIIDCLSRVNDEDRVFLMGRIQFKSGIAVQSIGDLQNISIDVIIDALGARGKKFLHEICSDPAARRQIVDAIPNDVCSALQNELSDIVKKCEFPTITLPDFFPTIDIIADISIAIELAITDAILVALLELIKSMIDQILNCEDGFKTPNFGALNWADLLAKTFNVNVASDSFISLKSNLMGSIALRAGLAGAETLIGLVDDVSALASPGELANLLNGDADPDIIKLIRCLIDKKYQSLSSSLDSDGKIDDFFKMLGDALDKGPLLEQIGQLNAPAVIRFDEICEVPEDNNFRTLLANKGLTKEEIDNQVAAAKKRKEDMFDNLMNNLLKGNPLSDALPPIFCKTGPNGKATGLVQRDHPSFTFMLDKTIDLVYDGVHMSFNNEISNFVSVLKEITTVPVPRAVERRIEVTAETEDGEQTTEVENPEFRRLISQGVSVENPNDDGDPVIVFEDAQFTTGFAAQGLKKNLETLDTDSRLFKFDPTGKISLVIPNFVDTNNLSDKISKIKPGNVKDPTLLDFLNKFQQSQNAGTNNVTEYNIDYNFLLNKDAKKNDFSITINKHDASQNITVPMEQPLHVSADVPPNILNFIQNKKLKRDEPNRFGFGTPEPQAYFGSYIADIWNGGASIYRDGVLASKPNYTKGVSAPSTINAVNSQLRDKFKIEAHQNLFVDIFSVLSKQVAKSPLFNLKVFSLLDFTPDVIPGQCEPHLLDLAKIKKKMKKAIEDSKCEEDLFPTTSGQGKNVPNSMEREGINGAIRTFIRLIVIENILKSIFVFSEFRITDISQLDNTISSFFARRVLVELTRTGEITKDPVFGQQFTKELLQSYNLSIAKGEIEAEKTTEFEVAAEYYVKIEVASVIKRIIGLMKRRDGANNIDLDKILMTQYVPMFDVQSSDGITPRFAKHEQKFFETRNFQNLFATQTIEDAKGNKIDVPVTIREGKEADQAANVSQGIPFVGNSPTPISLGNGNFVLERYVRIAYKNEEHRLNTKVDAAKADALKTKKSKPSPQNVSAHGFGRYHPQPSTANLSLTSSETKKVTDEIKRKQFGVLSFNDFNALLKDVIVPEIKSMQRSGLDFAGPEPYDFNKGMTDIFTSITYGLRLVYVPPLGTQDTFDDASIGFNGLLSSIVHDDVPKIDDVITLDKSFKVSEKITETTTTVRIDSVQGRTVQGAPVRVDRTRDVFEFPLICSEISENLQTVSFDLNNIDVMSKWTKQSEQLLNNLMATDEYDFLFHYCIPIDKMFALLLIYNITYLSGLEKVSTLFDGTKIAIKSVFQALLNSGNYRYEDQYVNDQLGGNIGLNTNGLNNADTKPDIPGTSVAAMAARTPFLILKGLVELTDLNINIARKVTDIAKANGKNIPIIVPSLAQLPMNVFPPPPMGPGIGVPITPLGFVYLALNIDEIFDAAKGKDVKRDDIGVEVGIDFKGPQTSCPDEET